MTRLCTTLVMLNDTGTSGKPKPHALKDESRRRSGLRPSEYGRDPRHPSRWGKVRPTRRSTTTPFVAKRSPVSRLSLSLDLLSDT